MAKLGMVGGTGPESTVLYYREIASRYQKRHPEGAFPELAIDTVNMYEMLGYCRSGDFDRLEAYLMEAVRNLEAARTDFIVLTANVPHVVFDRLQKRAHVPMLSILEPTCREIAKQGLRRVALLGTGFTMEQPYFKTVFAAHGIDAIAPDVGERKAVDGIIAHELEFGVVKDESKAFVDRVIERLVDDEDAQGVVLGCTELPLMYAHAELPVPAFDTMQLHLDGIVDRMLEY